MHDRRVQPSCNQSEVAFVQWINDPDPAALCLSVHSVFKATDKTNKNKVALKVIDRYDVCEPDVLDNLKRYAGLLQLL